MGWAIAAGVCCVVIGTSNFIAAFGTRGTTKASTHAFIGFVYLPVGIGALIQCCG